MGAQASRLAKAGGDLAAAKQMLHDEYSAGAKGWSAAQRAAYENPATQDAWLTKQVGQSTKGKYSGPLGGLVKTVGKAAPLAALIPGVGIPLAAALGAGGQLISGGGVKGALTGAALGAGGAALTGGKGVRGLADLVRGGPAAATAAAPTPAAQGGILGAAKNLAGGLIGEVKKNPLRAAQIGLAGLSTLQGAKRQGSADQLLNRATAPISTPRVNLSDVFADPANPYTGGGGNRAASAARRALAGG